MVTIHSTVPIPCYSTDNRRQCGVPLALTVYEPGQSHYLQLIVET